jgi:hypothetical protein
MQDTIKYNYGFGSAQELLEKVIRDRDAVLSALKSQDDNAIKDSIFNFVVTGYHIKDWLKHEHTNLKKAIEVLLEENKYLAICRALANGSKHKNSYRQ